MAQILYHKNYTHIDTTRKEELNKACMCSLREIGELKDFAPCFQKITEEKWAPFRSFLILCDLHAMKFAGQMELIATDTENVFEAILTLLHTPLDADDIERLTVIFQSSKSFTVLHAGEERFTLCASYSFSK